MKDAEYPIHPAANLMPEGTLPGAVCPGARIIREIKRAAYDIHPAAKLFPEPSQQDYDALKADIKANGQRFPIIVQDEQVIDGKTRYKICQELGITSIIKFLPDGVDPWEYAYSANLTRRHLTDDQRALCVARYAERHPKPTGAAAHRAKSDPMGVGVETVAKTGATASNPALAEGAKKFSVSMTKAKKARSLLKKDPAKAKEVHEGKTTLAKALREVEAKTPKATAADAKAMARQQKNFTKDLKRYLEDARYGIADAKEKCEWVKSSLQDDLEDIYGTVTPSMKSKAVSNVVKLNTFLAILAGLSVPQLDFDFTKSSKESA